MGKGSSCALIWLSQAVASGNPLVVGKTVCFYGARYFDRASSSMLFENDSESATVDEFPEVLGDVTAWNKLFDETMAGLMFTVDGEPEELNLEATLNLLTDADRSKRAAASRALAVVFDKHIKLFV